MKQARVGRWKLIAAGWFLLFSVGCGHKKPTEIAVITPTGGMEYWGDFTHAVRAHAEVVEMHPEVAAPQSFTDYAEQAQMVDSAIARHVEGIIVVLNQRTIIIEDRTLCVPLLRQCKEGEHPGIYRAPSAFPASQSGMTNARACRRLA